MEITSEDQLQGFWDKFDTKGRPVLFLDYDGTLAPFTAKRDEAFPYPGVRDLLNKIQHGLSKLVFVSGRIPNEVESLLQLNDPAEIWGSHGFERLTEKGKYTAYEMDELAVRDFERSRKWAKNSEYSEMFEIKPRSIALHWRGKDPDESEKIKKLVLANWEPLARNSGLTISGFDGGMELSASSINKGFAVNSVLSELSFGSHAYLGDDLTDENAFNAINSSGLSVLVRQEHRNTNAKVWIKPPEELIEFLTNWERKTSLYN